MSSLHWQNHTLRMPLPRSAKVSQVVYQDWPSAEAAHGEVTTEVGAVVDRKGLQTEEQSSPNKAGSTTVRGYVHSVPGPVVHQVVLVNVGKRRMTTWMKMVLPNGDSTPFHPG